MPELMRHDKNIRRKVLVVDDELINRRLLGFIVNRDYDVIYAENGVQALEYIRSNMNTLSLVLLDLIMPEMNGYELLEILQRDSELRRIPVIVLTSEKTAEVQALQLGAVDFITKPYDLPEVILARVHRSIKLAEDNNLIQKNERDALTNLFTKGFFFEYAKRHDKYFPDVAMDALVMNINRFHIVNDFHGRAYGDTILKAIAEIIRNVLAEADGLACRCESDTFYVYIAHRDDYKMLFEEYTKRLVEITKNANIALRIGIYQNVDMSIDIEARFDRANSACSKLRNSYQTVYGIYDEQLHEKEMYQEQLIAEMDTALEEKQFKVFFQPKYSIQCDKPQLTSAEALIRWLHPEQGMISPGVFIPLFEENGMVQKLDRYVWSETASQIRKWKDKYNKTINVSVNVSRLDILDPNLENIFIELIKTNGIEPGEMLLEITESAYTESSHHIIETVESLRSKGFRIEMDDFGSGYSSLNMLASLPIDALKLDMQFIKNITTSEKDMKIVGIMIEISKLLNVPLIAEGVETEEQYMLLKKAGCDIIQGYYFSKPLPPEDFEKLIEAEE